MNFIECEIDEVNKICEKVIPNSKVIACTPVLVRIDVKQNQSRQVSCCLRFPQSYPDHSLLVEIKSKTLSTKFADGLAGLCESKAQEILGKPQIIHVLKFVEQYLRENPLCVAYDEIVSLKKHLGEDSGELKLKQKLSSVQLTAKGGCFFYKIKAIIPEEYPDKCVELQEPETNLPPVLLRYLNGQSKEIARQCVEPPLRQVKDKSAQPFKPQPSLYKSLKFCIEATRDFYQEVCPICHDTVLPPDSQNAILDETHDMHVERVYCGHLFHQGCLKRYMSEPPFPKGGKLCPAKKHHPRSDTRYNTNAYQKSKDVTNSTCDMRIAHDRWALNVKVAESRWAQKQARERELEEVVDFLQ